MEDEIFTKDEMLEQLENIMMVYLMDIENEIKNSKNKSFLTFLQKLKSGNFSINFKIYEQMSESLKDDIVQLLNFMSAPGASMIFKKIARI
ncbi:hypothetical protein CRV08_02010 [Halarcobacter ebronensis]|uniref:Uncharacterized protein n=1 Tax=Halarcobacter ebronensis TaxID=1462615 RepID=A0A4Q0YG01_9BACT|nr:hypothetical protein [Halarcobacter ebronensis]RXJ69500.1 hypothetical protein CRV08_02010 [Halarcobacter ebronensis]